MLSRSHIVQNPTGLHARPMRQFAEIAAAYPGNIRVRKGDKVVNGKSVLALLTLGARYRDTLTLEIEGDAAEEALLRLGELLGRTFQE